MSLFLSLSPALAVARQRHRRFHCVMSHMKVQILEEPPCEEALSASVWKQFVFLSCLETVQDQMRPESSEEPSAGLMMKLNLLYGAGDETIT